VIQMNSTTSRSSVVSALTLVAAVATIATATPAVASPPRGPEGPRVTSTSAYAEPLDALGGRTLAQYLADHYARDRRLG
jgi:hypothetical protein